MKSSNRKKRAAVLAHAVLAASSGGQTVVYNADGVVNNADGEAAGPVVQPVPFSELPAGTAAVIVDIRRFINGDADDVEIAAPVNVISGIIQSS